MSGESAYIVCPTPTFKINKVGRWGPAKIGAGSDRYASAKANMGRPGISATAAERLFPSFH